MWAVTTGKVREDPSLSALEPFCDHTPPGCPTTGGSLARLPSNTHAPMISTLFSSHICLVGTSDEKDAVLIARLTAQLHCYVPEPVDEVWGRLRHLGARRERLVGETVSQVQQMRDLLECVWPAALDAARQPFRSRTWWAAMSVILDRDAGDLARTAGWAWRGWSRRCAARSPALAARSRACGSCGGCSRRCLIRPGNRASPRRPGTRGPADDGLA